MNLYVYHDSDHGDIEVFDSLAKARKHAKEQWPDAKWDGQFRLGEYVEIVIRTAR